MQPPPCAATRAARWPLRRTGESARDPKRFQESARNFRTSPSSSAAGLEPTTSAFGEWATALLFFLLSLPSGRLALVRSTVATAVRGSGGSLVVASPDSHPTAKTLRPTSSARADEAAAVRLHNLLHHSRPSLLVSRHHRTAFEQK